MKMTEDSVSFNASAISVKSRMIVRLPEDASLKMPSRGQVSVEGTINSHPFKTVLEPDGYWGHWFNLPDDDPSVLNVKDGDVMTVELHVVKEWPEPVVPKDIEAALAEAPQKVKEKWQDITPMARWEWIRWVNATANDSTRAIRIEKTVSKLNGTHRRPCCFNLAACTDPVLSKSGRLSVNQK